MERNLKEALKHRRSYYAIDNQTTIPDAEIEEILDFAALHTPSAFNSQSTRMVLLLREQHRRLWDIVRNTLKKTIPAAAYASTEAKINKSFAAGYGTVLFFEVYRKLSLYITKNFRNGPSIPQGCINWPSGLCSKTPDSEPPCNITIP